MQWPPITSVLGPGRHGSVREILKYTLRMLLAVTQRPAFLKCIENDGVLRQLFSAQPRLFHPPLSSFLDRRFSVSERFTAALFDLGLARERFGEQRLLRMAVRQPECLSAPLPGLQLCLGLNEVNLQEGSWALSLRGEQGERWYNLSFGFPDDQTLLISSIQGSAASQEADGRERIRQLTKLAHGLRPPFLLLAAVRAVCLSWGVRHLRGIDPRHHIKGRWNQRRSRLKFDYREMWTEMGGTQQPDGYWALPLVAERRAMDDIPSRKRSAYRKRFDMLDQMAADIRTALLQP